MKIYANYMQIYITYANLLVEGFIKEPGSYRFLTEVTT